MSLEDDETRLGELLAEMDELTHKAETLREQLRIDVQKAFDTLTSILEVMDKRSQLSQEGRRIWLRRQREKHQ